MQKALFFALSSGAYRLPLFITGSAALFAFSVTTFTSTSFSLVGVLTPYLAVGVSEC